MGPEFSRGCHEWEGVPKGDSVLFVSKVSKSVPCAGYPVIEDVWLVTKPDKVFQIIGDLQLPLEWKSSKESEAGKGLPPESPKIIRPKYHVNSDGSCEERVITLRPGDIYEHVPCPSSVVVLSNVQVTKLSGIELGVDSGARSTEAIKEVILEHVGEIRRLHERYLKKNPNKHLELVLQFSINSSGDIVAIRLVTSNTQNKRFDDRIKDKVRRMKFKRAPTGLCEVSYSIVYKRQERAEAIP